MGLNVLYKLLCDLLFCVMIYSEASITFFRRKRLSAAEESIIRLVLRLKRSILFREIACNFLFCGCSVVGSMLFVWVEDGESDWSPFNSLSRSRCLTIWSYEASSSWAWFINRLRFDGIFASMNFSMNAFFAVLCRSSKNWWSVC